MPDNPAALVELLNLPDDVAGAWRDWFDRTCLPARAALPGVVAVRRGVGLVGSVRQMVLYDLAESAVTASPAWQAAEAALEAAEGGSPEFRAYRHHLQSVLYRQIGGSVVEGYRPPPEAEIVHGAFFEAPARHHDEFNDWYELEHIPAIIQVPGYFNARRFQAVDDETKFLALYDVASLEVAEGKMAFEATQSPWSDRIRAKIATARERRLFRVERLELGSGGKA